MYNMLALLEECIKCGREHWFVIPNGIEERTQTKPSRILHPFADGSPKIEEQTNRPGGSNPAISLRPLRHICGEIPPACGVLSIAVGAIVALVHVYDID